MPSSPRARESGPLSLLIITFYTFVVIGMPFGVLNIAWTHMQKTFNVSLDALGVLLTAVTLGQLTIAFLSGRVITRLGIRLFLLGGSLMLGLGALGYVLAPTWPILLIFSLFFGLGSGSIDAGVNTFVSARYKASHLNWVHACYGVGLTVGPVTVTFFVQTLDQNWRWSYAMILALSGALSTLFLLFQHGWDLDAPSGEPSGRSEAQAGGPTMLETLASPAVLIGMALFFFYAGTELSAGQLSNTLLTESRGVSSEVASFWISVYWASFTLGRLVIGAVTDRVSLRWLMRGCMLASVLGAALLWINLSSVISLAGLVVLGFALAPMFATLIAETPGRVGLRHTPNAIGFQIASSGLGMAALPGLGGFLASRVGLESIGPFLVVSTLIVLFMFELSIHPTLQNIRAPAPSSSPGAR